MRIGYLMQAGVADVRQKPLSGPAQHVKHVCQQLTRLGHEVLLLVYLDKRIWKSNDLETFEPVTVAGVDALPFRLMESTVRRFQYELQLPYMALFESVRFALACRQELSDCDLLYERMGWFAYGGSLAARWIGIPFILEVNGNHLLELEMRGISPQGLQRWLSVKLMQFAIDTACRVVAAGEGTREAFLEQWLVDSSHVVVIKNGSELVELLDRKQLRSFSSEDAPCDTSIIFVGSFEPWHGVMVLVRSFAWAVKRGALARLTLAGTGSQREVVQGLIRELQITEHVTMTGHLSLPQLATYLAEADIGVAPYCGGTEYTGMKLFDYKAAGLATIASGQGGQPAVLEHGRTGWIVPPCNEESLGQAILHLCSDSGLRRRIGQAARVEAESQHSWLRTALELESLFTQVMSKSPPRPIRHSNHTTATLRDSSQR